MSALLGNGWWSSGLGWGGGHARHAEPGEDLRFLLELDVTCEDGSHHRVMTGPGWRIHPSAVLEDTLYHGETFDARLEPEGWDRPGFDDGDWPEARPLEGGLKVLCAQKGPPLRVTGQLLAKTITPREDGAFILDFGQNHAGRCRITVRNADPGTKITLRHSETLNPDGSLYIENYRSARVTDVYFCRGGEEEVWEPEFTYGDSGTSRSGAIPARPRITISSRRRFIPTRPSPDASPAPMSS